MRRDLSPRAAACLDALRTIHADPEHTNDQLRDAVGDLLAALEERAVAPPVVPPDDGKLSGAVRALDAAISAVHAESDRNAEDPLQVLAGHGYREDLYDAARLVLDRWC